MEAAAFAWRGVQPSAVTADDRPHDGKSQADTGGAGNPGTVQATEWLEQKIELLGRYDRPGVDDGQFGLARKPPGCRRHTEPAARVVMPDAVAHEVQGDTFKQDGVA